MNLIDISNKMTQYMINKMIEKEIQTQRRRWTKNHYWMDKSKYVAKRMIWMMDDTCFHYNNEYNEEMMQFRSCKHDFLQYKHLSELSSLGC